MDFLSLFPREISDIILGYLSKSDVRNASLVSKHWYNCIANSKKCMSKITLCYTGQLDDKDINAILNSKRRYQNIRVMCNQDEFTKTRRIENVLRLILNKFSDSITYLLTSNDTKRVNLPKLKHFGFRLNANLRGTIHPNGILSSSSHIIERLDIRCVLDEKSIEVMKNILKNMTNLKSLTGAFYVSLVNWKSWFDRQFSLKEVSNPSRANINEFLLEHAQTLERVRLTSVQNLAFLLSNFPHLDMLFFESLTTQLTVDYPLNETVTTLIIANQSNGNLDYSIIRLLSKLKNLKVIKILTLNFEVLIAIYSLRESLKILMFREIVENTDIMRLGLKLLSLHVKVYQVIFGS